MHALCRSFLEHLGPGHESGDHEMMPFLVKMDRLFELFVVRWLEKHLPSGFLIQSQEQMLMDANHDIKFKIDLSYMKKEPVAAPLSWTRNTNRSNRLHRTFSR
jgi:5-methylcytosine-specific restriction enzyme subunit McrC